MASEIFERVSFEADELTARVATYSCYLTMRLVTPLLEYEDGSVKKGNFAHATSWCWNYQTLESEKKGITYVCSKIDRQKTASEIVKSVNLLIAIQWGKQAWDSINCRLLLVISSLPLLELRVFAFYLKFTNLTTQADLSSLSVAAQPNSFLSY